MASLGSSPSSVSHGSPLFGFLTWAPNGILCPTKHTYPERLLQCYRYPIILLVKLFMRFGVFFCLQILYTTILAIFLNRESWWASSSGHVCGNCRPHDGTPYHQQSSPCWQFTIQITSFLATCPMMGLPLSPSSFSLKHPSLLSFGFLSVSMVFKLELPLDTFPASWHC